MSNGPTLPGIDSPDGRILIDDLSDKALERLLQKVKWPFILAAAVAAFTGYNVWSESMSAIDGFHAKADQKLEDIDATLQSKIDERLSLVIKEREGDIDHLTNRLRTTSAEGIVTLTQIQHDALSKMTKRVDDAIVSVDTKSNDTLRQLEARLEAAQNRYNDLIRHFGQLRVAAEASADVLTDQDRIINQPAFKLLRAAQAQSLVDSDHEVVVAVVDTGVTFSGQSVDAQAFASRLLEGKSFVGDAGTEDVHGHGTNVAAMVAAIAPSAQVLPIKVYDSSGRGSVIQTVEGVGAAVNQGVDIIVVPGGSAGAGDLILEGWYEETLAMASSKGIPVVTIVAPESVEGDIGTPGRSPHTFAVTAVDDDGTKLSGISSGAGIAIAAPGHNIRTLSPKGYVESSGASVAAGMVAGVMALVKSARPDITKDELEAVIIKSAVSLSASKQDVGAGRLDALAAVQIALQ